MRHLTRVTRHITSSFTCVTPHRVTYCVISRVNSRQRHDSLTHRSRIANRFFFKLYVCKKDKGAERIQSSLNTFQSYLRRILIMTTLSKPVNRRTSLTRQPLRTDYRRRGVCGPLSAPEVARSSVPYGTGTGTVPYE